MWAIEGSPGPKAAYRGGGIILLPAIAGLPSTHLLGSWCWPSAATPTILSRCKHNNVAHIDE